MSDQQPQPVTDPACRLSVSSQEIVAKQEDCESEAPTEVAPNKSNSATTYGSVDNEIWATITPQQNASLEALHQSMRLSRGSNDESFSESDNQQQEKNQEQHQEQQQQQHQQQQQQQHQQQQQQAQSPQPQPQNQVQQVTPAEAEEKPAVGSEEWHRQRRENHKQVERRRRENINEGINQIARIVPGCEKNKGSILSRAAIYIRQLKDNEAATLEKWTLEKLLTDQAISELNRQVEMFKAELERVKLENNYLKRELDTVSNTESRSKKQKLDNLQDES